MSSEASLPVTPPCSLSGTPPSEFEDMYNTLRPIAYIHRGSNVYVPLIAVDELPPGVSVREVPRTVRLAHTAGMMNVGTFTPTGQYYTLDGLDKLSGSNTTDIRQQKYVVSSEQNSLITRQNQASTAMVNRNTYVPDTSSWTGTPNRAVAPDRSIQPSANSTCISNSPWVRNHQGTSVSEQTCLFPMALASSAAAATPAPAATAAQSRTTDQPQFTGSMALRLLPPSGLEPVQEKKQYCTFWIKSGCCDYTQQGCKYKHEMPDAKGLMAIGLPSDPPKWWKDQQLHKWRAPVNPKAQPGEDPTAAFKLPQPNLTTPSPMAGALKQLQPQRSSTTEASKLASANAFSAKPISTNELPRPIVREESPAQRQIDEIVRAPQRPPAAIPGYETLKPKPALGEQQVASTERSQPITPSIPKKPVISSIQSKLSPSPAPARGLADSRYSPGARFIPAGDPMPQSAIPITRCSGSPLSIPSTLRNSLSPSRSMTKNICSSDSNPPSPSLVEDAPSPRLTKLMRPAAVVSPSPSSSKTPPSTHPSRAARPATNGPRVPQIEEISSSEDAEDDEKAEIYPEHKRRSEIPQPKFQMSEVPKRPKATLKTREANAKKYEVAVVANGQKIGRLVKGRVVYDKPTERKSKAAASPGMKVASRGRTGSNVQRPNQPTDVRKDKDIAAKEQDLLDLS